MDLSGLGSAAGGFARGLQLGEGIQQIRDKRSERERQKQEQEILKEADGILYDKQYETARQVNAEANNPQHDAGLGNIQVPNAQGNGALAQVAQANQPQSLLNNKLKDKINFGTANSYYEAAKFLRSKGMNKQAMEYAAQGYVYEDSIVKRELDKARRGFEATGDIKQLVPFYNNHVHDGNQIDSYQKNKNGYAIKFANGHTVNYTKDQLTGWIGMYDDPEVRYKTRMSALADEAKTRFETDEKIRLEQAKEGAKVHKLGLDDMAYRGDGTLIHDGRQHASKFRNDNDVLAAASDPKDPRHQTAVTMLKKQKNQKVSIANASRAPRRATETERSFQMWKQDNPNGTFTQFREWLATLGEDAQYDTVAETESENDRFGHPIKQIKTTRKVPRGKGSNKPKQSFDKEAVFKNYGID